MIKPSYHDRKFYISWGALYDPNRKEGPATINNDGLVAFKKKVRTLTVRTRAKGPSIINSNGQIEYMKHGLNHRVDGPAVIYSDSSKEYWINGKKIDPTEFFLKYGVL